MSISEAMLTELDVEMESTRKMLAAVPEGKWDWKPHQKSMSLGVLTGHIANMATWGTDTIKTDSLSMGDGDYKPYIPESTADLLATFDKDKTAFREQLAGTSDEAMAKVWSMTWNGHKVVEQPRVEVIRGMVINHMIHHRGQLSVYLRLLDAKVPGTYGPSADDQQAMAS